MVHKKANSLESIKSINRFWYIEDEQVRDELYLSLYYVYYLHQELKNDTYDCLNIISSINHTVILYIGSIIEEILFNFVYNYFQSNGTPGQIKKYCKTIEYKEESDMSFQRKGKIYHICERKDRFQKFNKDINFSFLINGAKDKKIIPIDIIKMIDGIRKKRNTIHIKVRVTQGGSFIDDTTKIFKDTKKILDFFEKEYKKKV